MAFAGELKGARNGAAVDLDRARSIRLLAGACAFVLAQVELLDDREDVFQQLLVL